jgi:ribosomal protein S20
MALSNSDKKEIEVMVRKEIRNFMENNTIKQFEDKLMDKIQKEIKRGKLEGDIKDITLRMFREFYQFMWMNRSYWEPRLKNA